MKQQDIQDKIKNELMRIFTKEDKTTKKRVLKDFVIIQNDIIFEDRMKMPLSDKIAYITIDDEDYLSIEFDFNDPNSAISEIKKILDITE